MIEIKFDIVARNIFYNEISHYVYTLEQIWEGEEIASWLNSPNCEMLAKRRWTGLVDKNDVEIYEGDIIRLIYLPDGSNEAYPDGYWQGVVAYDTSHAAFMVGNHRLSDRYFKGGLEVMGNVYQNPELLEGPTNA